MSKRAVLITTSIAVHGAIAAGLIISGVWNMERLDPEKRTVSLAVMLPPPPAPSGSPAGADARITPKTPKTVVKTVVQPPVVKIDKPDATATAVIPGNGLGTTTGTGDNPDGKPDDTGTCVGVTCGPSVSKTIAPQPEIKIPPPKQPVLLPPSVLKALRTSGNTQLVPSNVVKQQMVREDHLATEATFKVCLDGAGAVTSITPEKLTGYPSYDDVIATGIRDWRYRPYTVDGVGTPFCARVTIKYSMN